MKKLGEMLLSEGPFEEIVMGDTAVVRGMIEAGVEVVTSYPGSPTPEIGSAIGSIVPDKRPFYFEYSTNEKVAAEVAFGSAINGRLSVVFFKSVGLNVAADSFVQFSLLDIKGGLVIILGDDPGANSSQNEQDNRHLAQMAYTPVLEPATPSEVYTMFLKACRISREKHMPVILRMTTHVCHGKEKTLFGKRDMSVYHGPDIFNPTDASYIPLTSRVAGMKRRALEKLSSLSSDSDHLNLAHFIDNNNPARGIITCGMPRLSLEESMAGMSEKPDILILEMPYPLPEKAVIKFCEGREEVLILEELDPVIQKQVTSLAWGADQRFRIIGKTEPDDFIGELTPGRVRQWLGRKWPEVFNALPVPENQAGTGGPEFPPRPAQMCPGCGHRSAFHAIKQVLSADDITVGDIGCHTLGYMEPYNIGQVLLSMGHSNGTGAGLSMFRTSGRVVTFLGDSTFFHAGLPGIINALFNNHDITLIIMENGTTAMTGHQEHPGTGKTMSGEGVKLSIRKVLEGLGVGFIREVDTYRQAELSAMVKEAMAFKGLSVVIARHPCMLKFSREKRRKGIKQNSLAKIDPKSCKNLKECISRFACPSFQRDPLDGSISVNPELCIGDGSCLQTCPAEAVRLKKGEGDE
ncbi:MAG: indolepyruvate ferredoxin oxidoreductase subunit alpha [Spirochaetales bacterium]|nr:indolepyruvate ferredoxin oxidoreductase subunit alpha [Spirochaetales bacterium]